jgi:hypothetical protein
MVARRSTLNPAASRFDRFGYEGSVRIMRIVVSVVFPTNAVNTYDYGGYDANGGFVVMLAG